MSTYKNERRSGKFFLFRNLFRMKDRKDHEWHYRGLAASLSELQDTFAYKEFEQLINQVFG